MPQDNHTTEPWNNPLGTKKVLDANGIMLTYIGGEDTSHLEDEDNARRIAAAINCVAGISTDSLEFVAKRFPGDRAATLRYLATVCDEAAQKVSAK